MPMRTLAFSAASPRSPPIRTRVRGWRSRQSRTPRASATHHAAVGGPDAGAPARCPGRTRQEFAGAGPVCRRTGSRGRWSWGPMSRLLWGPVSMRAIDQPVGAPDKGGDGRSFAGDTHGRSQPTACYFGGACPRPTNSPLASTCPVIAAIRLGYPAAESAGTAVSRAKTWK